MAIDAIQVILKMTVSEKQPQTAFLLHTISDGIEYHFFSNVKSFEWQLKFTSDPITLSLSFYFLKLRPHPPRTRQSVSALQNNEQTVKASTEFLQRFVALPILWKDYKTTR